MSYFRQMTLSSVVIHAVWLALALGLFFTTLSRRSRSANIIFGGLIVICVILAALFDIRAYQLSY
jgi:VanZ family protein